MMSAPDASSHLWSRSLTTHGRACGTGGDAGGMPGGTAAAVLCVTALCVTRGTLAHRSGGRAGRGGADGGRAHAPWRRMRGDGHAAAPVQHLRAMPAAVPLHGRPAGAAAAGTAAGGLPGLLVQGEEEQVGGEELEKNLEDLGTVWKVWRMQYQVWKWL